MERFGLTDDEMREYGALTEKWRRSTMLKGPPLTAEEETRYQRLDNRTVYQFWPAEKEDPVVKTMLESGFFLVNPRSEGDIAPASMYFEPDEAAFYVKEHPNARVWTVVEGDNDTEWLEQGWHLVNRIAHMMENPDWRGIERLVPADGT